MRRRSTQWEPKPSPGKFSQPLVVSNAGFGNLYIQGSITNQAGKELSPEEVARLIESHGHNAVNKFEGSFVIAVDDRRHGIWCATDHSATLPLYYKLTPDELVVTTRAENLKVAGPDDLDPAGIIAALNSGYPWGKLTLLNAWKAFRPGQILRIDKQNSSSISYYFDPETDESVQGFHSAEELLKEIDTGLISIASRYKKILIPLSGGVDSRLIAVRCNKLGIPFEAITFVANVHDGDDFDIASRLVKIFNVRHHRWEWRPSPEDCIENFTRLCIATGGVNDAYTSYPDGMDLFADVASEFDCILRGDHVFGFGPFSDSILSSSFVLNINLNDNLNWALMPEYRDRIDIQSIFEKEEDVSINLQGRAANDWRHKSFRMSRSPRFLLQIGQLQARHTVVAYPFLTKGIVKRMARTKSDKRDSKRIALETLEIASPPEIRRIPISTQPTWKKGEPLLNLPKEIINEMIRIVGRPCGLSQIINESTIIDAYTDFISGKGQMKTKGDLTRSLKEIAKRMLPKNLVATYQASARQHLKVPPHMTFKRYFAMKAYIDSIS
jgi:hypothetical protein